MRTTVLVLITLSLNLLLAACAGSADDQREQDDAAVQIPAAEGAAPAAEARADAASPAGRVSARSLEEVEKAFEARREAFRHVNSSRLSQKAGTFNVTVTFAASGEVVECRMLSTDFHDDPAFNAAVMAEVWRLRLSPRPGAGEFVVSSYPIAFSARSEAIVAPPSMPILSPPPPPPAPAPPPPPSTTPRS